MLGFWLILGSMILGDVAFALWTNARLRRIGRRGKVLRIVIATFVAMQILYLIWFISFPTTARTAHPWLPMPVLAIVYLWHLIVLPLSLISIGVGSLVVLVIKLIRRPKQIAASDENPASPTRREFLTTVAAVSVPPIITGFAVGQSMMHLTDFRIRRFDLSISNLPRALDGMTIAHLSDLHVGRWTRPGFLNAVVEATNQLRADLVLFTGDLIDIALADLSTGIAAINKLDPRHGLFLVEGNHDLIESRFEFERRVVAANLPVIFDDARSFVFNGQIVQILGIRWSRGQEGIAQSMSQVLPKVRSDAFPILLAHHPHAFDPAINANLPLTLAGHTHGGQIMLTDKLGGGPTLFRYWSGLYRQKNSQMVVSNGVGNWFPLRINAPAEIVHITLRT